MANTEALKKALKNPISIRNVCILAHVDHGKTTIADSLLATNGLISKRLAGQVRFLDDRQDEQERGITMKSSAVSLHYQLGDEEMVLNLIDTPGHIDFSTEVSAAVRICDGALIVVDLVEGVCAQTRDAIKQAYDENIKMILILNKIDRLVLALHQSAEDMFNTILRVIEDCNVVIAELCQYDAENIENADEFSFSPEKGNVIFASATDGWGVTTELLSKAFFDLLTDETPESLSSKIWNFDCYVESSSRRIVTGAIQKRKENVFIQLFLKTIYYLYYTFIIRMERDNLPTVLKKLKITSPTREMTHKSPHLQVKAILQSWNPIAQTIMKQCYDKVPSPANIEDRKLNNLIRSNRYFSTSELNDCADEMLACMRDAASKSCIVYISKMFSVNKMSLPQNKPKIFVPTRTRNVRQPENSGVEKAKDVDVKETPHVENSEGAESKETENVQENIIIALGRVFGGTLKVGDDMYILGSDYDLSKPEDLKKVTIKELYMLLGRELVQTNEIPFGNVCGIGGLDDLVLRTATLSSTTNCLPLSERIHMEPIVRNTIEPVNPKDIQKLRQGLKYLAQSDSCVQVVMQETGEHVLVTAGDVHLAKCLEDLKTKFIDFDVKVSKPMVLFRETVYHPKPNIRNLDTAVKMTIRELGVNLEVIVVAIPIEIERAIKANHQLLQMVQESKVEMENHTIKLKEQLTEVFKGVPDVWGWSCEKIWSIGKGTDSVNLLVNNTGDYQRNIFTTLDEKDPRSNYDHHIVSGFEMCCRAGPICEEPLTNCAFFVLDYRISEPAAKGGGGGGGGSVHMLANMALTIKNCLREAFLKQEQRLVEPIFTTDIQVNVHILGKVYSVLGKRHGKVLEAVGMDQEERTFRVKAQIPVVESDGFANEIRKATSGQANPTLRFSHYEIVDADPYYEGEEDDETDACADALRANKLMKETRRRKGLLIDEQVVVHAEKQRTLNKKK